MGAKGKIGMLALGAGVILIGIPILRGFVEETTQGLHQEAEKFVQYQIDDVHRGGNVALQTTLQNPLFAPINIALQTYRSVVGR